MKFNELPKQKQLLIYMFNHECSSNKPITIARMGDEIIAAGITKNKNSLANMLYNLRKKKLVSETILRDGSFVYSLTASGQDDAKYWISRCNEDEWFPGGVEQPSENEEAVGVDWASLANMFADVANRFAQQPTQNDKLQEENAALAKEVDKLKYDLHCATEAYNYIEEERNSLKETIEKIRANMNAVCNALDVKTKECERLKAGLDHIANSLKKMGSWTLDIKNGIALA
jgi:archaellum component FlaC